jgi:hypothetical protein
MKKVVIVFMCLLVNACAMGTKINYSAGNIPLANKSYNFDGGCKISVVDKRPYVLSGRKAPNFVGIRRGGYGNPFNVVTTSGQSLADDLTSLFTVSFNIDGRSRCNLDGDNIRKELVYELNEWKTDVMIRGRLLYDVDTTISIDGEQAAKVNTVGNIVISRKYKLHQAVEEAFNSIHSKPEIVSALSM